MLEKGRSTGTFRVSNTNQSQSEMNETGTPSRQTRYFTLEQAQAMLPLVSTIAADIAEVFQQVTGRRSDLHRLLRGSLRSAGSVYDDEVAESRADLQEEYDRIWKYREELESLGVILRQSETGELEFPTTIEGREAYLCWKIGDETVAFWRFADSPTSCRTALRFDTSGN